MIRQITPIGRLFLEPPGQGGGDRIVSNNSDRGWTWDEFRCRTAGIAESIGAIGSGRWLIAAESSFDFATGLLGIWHGGGVAVLPPNLRAATLRTMTEGLAGTVGDDSIRMEPLPHIAPGPSGDETVFSEPLDGNRTLIELFTSGSTGRPLLVPKNLAQIDAELQEHESLWGPALEDASAISTVSHQHIYGLLFRLLWPLAAGRVFSDRTNFHWEEIFAEIAAAGGSYLVSSPAHLSRLHGSAEEYDSIRSCRLIFSSGGLLSTSAASSVGQVFGCAPVEVLGSTETGGVGWRRQVKGGETWQPLGGVELTMDGDRLRARSAYTSLAGDDGGYTLGDRGRLLNNGRFELLGRADRIVKIGGKRISLQELEDRLHENPAIRAAAVLSLEHGEGPRDSRIAAVIVPSNSGRRRLDSDGVKSLTAMLRSGLLDHFDRIALPRQFRYIDRMPVNLQGKIPMAELEKLFLDDAPSGPVRPVLVDKTKGDCWLQLALMVPEDLVYLEGHFDGYPIVPGVVVLEWVYDAATELLGDAIDLDRIEKVKFHGELKPGRRFELRVEHDRERSRMRYELRAGETRFASGVMVLSS